MALPGQIAFDASPDVRSALGALGRTEDVRFSRSGRRLALAGFRNDRIAVADLEVAGTTVAITGLRELASSSLHHPHGVDFLDEETLVVGNRKGGVVLLRLPGVASDDGVEWIDPLGPAWMRITFPSASRSFGAAHLGRSTPGPLRFSKNSM